MSDRMHKGAIHFLYQRARELRNNATPAENVLWGYLKTKPKGCKFRRQHPYSIYILDFYCHALQLVIEVDGSIHDQEEVKKKDIKRQHDLEHEGLTLLRFSNEEILYNLETVINRIENHFKKPTVND